MGDDRARSAAELWASFPQDPTAPGNAQLRAGDVDRDRVHEVLGQAYADGRLDPAEFEERTEAVARARTLGELPPLVADLVPAAPVPARRTPRSFAEQAGEEWRRALRHSVWGFVSASLICWVVWAVTMLGEFPWPVFVMLGTGLNVGRVLVMRGDIVAEETRRLERKEEKRARGELPPGPDGS